MPFATRIPPSNNDNEASLFGASPVKFILSIIPHTALRGRNPHLPRHDLRRAELDDDHGVHMGYS